MNSKWIKYIRKTGKLKVFNLAESWAMPIAAAQKTFNALKFGVELVKTDTKESANIVVKSASGPDSYSFKNPWYEGALTTTADFKADTLHGLAVPALDPKLSEIVFCVIFLPGGIIKNATKEQKEMVVVHEFIHACGVLDHEMGGVGIMAYPMQKKGKGLIEVLPDKDSKPMPPIRIGGQTSCAVRGLWAEAETDQKN